MELSSQISGKPLATVMLPHRTNKVNVASLQRRAMRACLHANLLHSRNQRLYLFLDDSWLSNQAALVWARIFATHPPKRRLVKKTNLSKFRLERQLCWLRGGANAATAHDAVDT